MGARAEGLPWERQPREGEEAYAAFLAYRDLGPGRTHEATRKQPRQEAGLPQADRAVVGPPGLAAAGVRLGRPPASRARQGRPRRRRRSGSGAGSRRWRRAGSSAGRCGPGWSRCSPSPRRRRPSPRPSRPGRRRRPSPTPSRRPRRPGDGGTRADAGERPGGGAAVEAGRRAGVGAPGRGLAAPRDDRPADGDGRGDQGVPGPPSPLRPPAAALTRPPRVPMRVRSPALETGRCRPPRPRPRSGAVPGRWMRPPTSPPSGPRMCGRGGMPRAGLTPPPPRSRALGCRCARRRPPAPGVGG